MSQEFPVLQRRDLACPDSNGTTYTDSGYSWAILCDWDYPGNDLPSQPASTFADCVTACNNYKRDESSQNGASCVAVVYAAGNPNGNPCFLKSSIDQVNSGVRESYAARRLQYNVGDPPILSSITPSASAAAATVQPSTSTPNIATVFSNAIVPVSPTTVTVNNQSRQGTTSKSSNQNTGTQSSATTSIPRATVTSASSSSSSPAATPLANTVPIIVTTVTSDGTPRNIIAQSTGSQTNVFSASSTGPGATPTSTASPSQAPATVGLSDGAKIGIGIGAGVAAAVIFSLLLYIICARHRRRSQAEPKPIPPTELPTDKLISTAPPSYRRAITPEKSRLSPAHEINTSETGAYELGTGRYSVRNSARHSGTTELDTPSSAGYTMGTFASKISPLSPTDRDQGLHNNPIQHDWHGNG